MPADRASSAIGRRAASTPTATTGWSLTSRNGVDELLRRGSRAGCRESRSIGRGNRRGAPRARRRARPRRRACRRRRGCSRSCRGPPGRVLFAGAEGARDVLVRELGADFVALYRTVELRPESFPEADLVVLASASAARALAALGPAPPCVSIGPVTTAAARARGLQRRRGGRDARPRRPRRSG